MMSNRRQLDLISKFSEQATRPDPRVVKCAPLLAVKRKSGSSGIEAAQAIAVPHELKSIIIGTKANEGPSQAQITGFTEQVMVDFDVRFINRDNPIVLVL
jgi:RNase H-fold protein (predicted Holliday junction resolvase)